MKWIGVEPDRYGRHTYLTEVFGFMIERTPPTGYEGRHRA